MGGISNNYPHVKKKVIIIYYKMKNNHIFAFVNQMLNNGCLAD